MIELVHYGEPVKVSMERPVTMPIPPLTPLTPRPAQPPGREPHRRA